MPKMKINLFNSTFLFLILATVQSHAAEVTQVKDNKVLIQVDTENIQPEQEFYLTNEAGKKVGLIQITQVKNSKAIGTLTKGKADVGMKLLAKTAAPISSDNSGSTNSREKYQPKKEDYSSSSSSSKNKNSWGILLGYSMQTMSATFKGGVPVQDYSLNMTGSNLSYFGFFNYVYSPNLIFELSGGLYPLKVTTTIKDTACIGQTKECNVNINYFDGALLAKYYLPFKIKHKFWLGGGMDFLMPSSKSTTVLSESDIGMNQMFRFGFGTDLFLIGKKSFIPIQIDYSMFPPSTGVSSTAMNIRFGYGSQF